MAETSGDPDRTVVVGAHLDSVPAGPGINDNGSGSGGILEIAEQYAERGLEPRNRIRFMWFGAEERGLLGSNYYVDQLTEDEKDQILVNLNFDMIGSPNGARLVYDGDNSAFPVGPGAAEGPEGSGLIEGVFASYFRNQGLSTRRRRSPAGRTTALHRQRDPGRRLVHRRRGPVTARYGELFGCTVGCADPCYHQACDTLMNVKLPLLHEMSDAAAHATYTFAQTKADIVDEGVLDPARARRTRKPTRPPGPATAASTRRTRTRSRSPSSSRHAPPGRRRLGRRPGRRCVEQRYRPTARFPAR